MKKNQLHKTLCIIVCLAFIIASIGLINPVYAAIITPRVYGVSFFGLPIEGQTLVGSYHFYGGADNKEGNSQFRWLISDDANGTYVPISGATGNKYVIKSTDKGKYIKFEVTPYDSSQNAIIGTTQTSLPTKIVDSINLVSQATVTVTSGDNHDNLKDGDFDTLWKPASADGQSISIDLGADKTFNMVVLKDDGNVVQYSMKYATEQEPNNFKSVIKSFDNAAADSAQNSNGANFLFAPVTARYLKLDLTCSSAPSIYEVQVYDYGFESTDLALYKPVLTSSKYAKYYGHYLTDGATNNFGCGFFSGAITEPVWAQVDLGKPYTFNTVICYDNARINSYRIQVSDDAVNWSDVFASDYISMFSHKMIFPSTTARYVRIYIEGSDGTIALKSLQVYNQAYEGDNLAYGKATRSSSVYATNYPGFSQLTNDDDTEDTYWRPKANTGNYEWFYVDLGAITRFNKINLSEFTTFSTYSSYTLSYSDDAVAWTDILTSATPIGYGKKEHTFSPVFARYVRFMVPPSSSPCITNIEVLDHPQEVKEFSRIEYSGENGSKTVLHNIIPGINRGSMTVYNFTNTAVRKYAIAGLYSEDKLVDVIMKPLDIEPASSEVFDFSFTVDETDSVDQYAISTFCWDGLDTITPYKENRSLILPSFFTDKMVIQQNQPVKIWGKGIAGDTVTVQFNSDTKAATVGNDGNWSVVFEPVAAGGGPMQLVVSDSKDKIVLNDILMGEVFLCSGQSNMAYGMDYFQDSRELMKTVNNPNIRIFQTARQSVSHAMGPQFDVSKNSTGWNYLNIAETYNPSATATYFALDLYDKLNVPIGIIQSAYPGSGINVWLRSDAPNESSIKGNSNLFYGMIAPYFNLNLAGILWYQGEADAVEEVEDVVNTEYQKAFKALINDWRLQFNQPDLPFLFVQLPRYEAADYRGIRDMQLKTLIDPTMSKLGMVVSIDTGEKADLHPSNKPIIGQRLSLLAQKIIYGRDVVSTGPIYNGMSVSGDKIIISFLPDSVGTGLKASDGGALKGFKIAGSDKNFVDANAVIVGNTVEVSADSVSAPVSVRYAVEKFPTTNNLVNNEGMPASPFKTDDWAIELPQVQPTLTLIGGADFTNAATIQSAAYTGGFALVGTNNAVTTNDPVGTGKCLYIAAAANRLRLGFINVPGITVGKTVRVVVEVYDDPNYNGNFTINTNVAGDFTPKAFKRAEIGNKSNTWKQVSYDFTLLQAKTNNSGFQFYGSGAVHIRKIEIYEVPQQ
jgi:sialate O-acetylesterase